jgi:hypothetical protein
VGRSRAEANQRKEKQMIRPFKLAKIFAAVGFCVGVLASGLGFYLDARGLSLPPWIGLPYIVLFPMPLLLIDYDGGKILLACILLVLSVVNGFLYAAVGLVIVQVVATLRERLARPRV